MSVVISFSFTLEATGSRLALFVMRNGYRATNLPKNPLGEPLSYFSHKTDSYLRNNSFHDLATSINKSVGEMTPNGKNDVCLGPFSDRVTILYYCNYCSLDTKH